MGFTCNFTGKEHRNVTIDIERILKEAEIDTQGFLHIYLDTGKKHTRWMSLHKSQLKNMGMGVLL